jgi:hypothetical protein
MNRKFRKYDRNGVEIEDDDEALKDGERIRVSINFLDAARNRDIREACDERNAMNKLSPEDRDRLAEYEAYEKRITDAWRGPKADNDCLEDDFDDSPEAERARYIERITNAWRAGPWIKASGWPSVGTSR